MPFVEALWIYPVKSLAGIAVTEAIVEDRGFRGDRRFMVIDSDGRFVTQREHARMALIHTGIEGEVLRLSYSQQELRVPIEIEGEVREVVVWDDRVSAIDAGDRVAEWLSDAIGTSVRLVRMPKSVRRTVDSRYARELDVVSFADGFPFLLTSDASLAALNARLPHAIDQRRFRPNIVAGGVESAFDEDRWSEIAVGPITLFPRKACGRCVMVDVDPDTAERGKSVLALLAEMRREGSKVLFGQNLIHDGEGTIRVGDPLLVRSRASLLSSGPQ